MNMHINAVLTREIEEGVQIGFAIKFDPIAAPAFQASIVQYDVVMPAFQPQYDKVPEGVLTPVAADISGKGRENLVDYQKWLLRQAVSIGLPGWLNHPNAVVRAFAEKVAKPALEMPGLRPIPAKWSQNDRRADATGREYTRSWFKALPYKAQNMALPAAELTVCGGLPAFAAVSEPSVIRGGADVGVSRPGTPDAHAYITQFLGEASAVAGEIKTSITITPLNAAVWAQVVRMAAAGNDVEAVHSGAATGGAMSIPAIGGGLFGA